MALFGYHRKAAIRALRAPAPPVRTGALLLSRPREYDPQRLLPVLKPIWFAALLPEWLPAYGADHRRLDPDLGRVSWRPARAPLTACRPRCG